MATRAILELSDKWYKQGYEEFYSKLIIFHDEAGNTAAKNAALEKFLAHKKLITESLKAMSNHSLQNKKVQSMLLSSDRPELH